MPSAPLRPAPDRIAAGDQAFDPNRHLWVDGEWWSADGAYKWTGADWTLAVEVAARAAAGRHVDVVVNDHARDEVGRHAAWPTDDDVQRLVVKERRLGYSKWAGPGDSLMLLYLPVTIGVLIVELSVHVPIGPALISAMGVAVAFMLAARRINRGRP